MKRTSFFGALVLSAALGLIAGCGDAGSGDPGGGNAGGGNSGGGGNGNGASGGGGTTGAGAGQPSSEVLYGPAIKTIVLEVDYATGAEPYTGAIVGMGDTWDLFDKNAKSLFEGGDKTLVVPRTLDDMEELTDISGKEFVTDDILAIAEKHRGEANTDDKASFYVVWLDGNYKDDDGVQEQVLGASFGHTGIIAMFKPVIAGAGGPGPVVSHFVEQTTLVHEFGHAAGLVNNGVALATEHQDTAHGSHCSNQDCVMFWLNEGASDMLAFVQDSIAKGDTDLFGQECLDDAHAALQPK